MSLLSIKKKPKKKPVSTKIVYGAYKPKQCTVNMIYLYKL